MQDEKSSSLMHGLSHMATTTACNNTSAPVPAPIILILFLIFSRLLTPAPWLHSIFSGFFSFFIYLLKWQTNLMKTRHKVLCNLIISLFIHIPSPPMQKVRKMKITLNLPSNQKDIFLSIRLTYVIPLCI